MVETRMFSKSFSVIGIVFTLFRTYKSDTIHGIFSLRTGYTLKDLMISSI